MFFLFILFFKFIDLFGDNIFPRIKLKNNTEMIDNGYWRQYRICHPPFNWSLPKGLDKNTEKLFWAQPENMRHFLDTNSSEHCGIVRVVINGIVQMPFSHLTNTTHFVNARMAPRRISKPKYDSLIVLTGHWGFFFQHFFDNIGPQLSMMNTLLGEYLHNIPVLVDTSTLFPVVPKLWERIGFPEIIQSQQNEAYSARVLFYIESTPMVHPLFFQDLRNLLHISEGDPKYIIWCTRKLTTSFYNQRFLYNEQQVINFLKKTFGFRLIVFSHSDYTLDETIELFSHAKAIIGVHGGAFYNQFYAPKDCVIIEILPVKENGAYPDQKSLDDQPSFAHMAVWSNSQLIGQKFYRFYQITDTLNFILNIQQFSKFVLAIPELKPFRNNMDL